MHNQNSTFQTKLKASGFLFFIFFSGCLSISSCFLTTRQDLAELKHSLLHKNHQTTEQLPKPQTSLSLSLCFCVCVSRPSEWGNGTFYCVILPLGRKGGGKEGGGVLETKPTLCFVVFLLFLKVRQH